MIYQSGNTDREEGEEAKHEKKRETQITQREMAVKRRWAPLWALSQGIAIVINASGRIARLLVPYSLVHTEMDLIYDLRQNWSERVMLVIISFAPTKKKQTR